MLTAYLLMVFVMQCLWALPPGLHEVRHHHVGAEASFTDRFALLAAQPHAHDSEVHTHGASTPKFVQLGEAGDEGSVVPALALWAGVWPAALLFVLALGREAFSRTAPVRFRSHGTRVPLQPPQRG